MQTHVTLLQRKKGKKEAGVFDPFWPHLSKDKTGAVGVFDRGVGFQ